MFIHETQVRVRYAETDQMGFVYYGQYAAYFEVGRVEAMRSLDCPYKRLEDEGVWMPVTSYSVRYLKPARYDDLLTVRTCISHLPGVRIVFQYTLYNSSGELLNEAETELVFLRASDQRPMRAPDFLIAALKPYFADGI